MQKELLAYYRSVSRSLTLGNVDNDTLDLAVLNYMGYTVNSHISQWGQQMSLQFPSISHVVETLGRIHRVIIYACPEDREADLSFVGFISRKRLSPDLTIVRDLDSMDRQLIMEIAHIPGLRSYSSLELCDGNWCNLVVFTRSGVKEDLLTIPSHRHAAFELAPHYYQWIRLHHGIITCGCFANGLILQKTKYYTDFVPGQRPMIRERIYHQTEYA